MDYENNNEALAIVKRMVADGQISQDVAEKYFPELKESEDDRIRKEIIKYLERTVPHHHHDEVLKSKEWIAWLEKKGQTFTKKDVDNAYLKGVCDTKHELEKQGEQKHVWSEEDEKMMNDTLAVVDWYAGKHRNISVKVENWLKLLKSRVLSPSIREFDKEEGSIIDHLISICDDAMCYDTFAGCSKKDIEKYKTFLTNLKFGIDTQKKQWKPSEEQMIELHRVISGCSYDIEPLVEMEEQLKKLKE